MIRQICNNHSLNMFLVSLILFSLLFFHGFAFCTELEWTRDPTNPIAGGIGIGGRNGEVEILQENGTYHLFYAEWYNTFHATSSSIDGPFTEEGMVLVTGDGSNHGGLGIMMDPAGHTAIKVSEAELGIGPSTTEQYWMFYADATNINIATNTSLNGSWTPRPEFSPCLQPTVGDWDSGKVGWDSLTVFKEGDTFYLFYAGTPIDYATNPRQSGFATSSDLINWTKSADNPVMPAVSGEWDSISVEVQDVWKSESTFIFAYTGFGVHPGEALGVVTSTDLVNFTKHPNNPLFEADAPLESPNVSDYALFRTEEKDYIFYEATWDGVYGIGRAWSQGILPGGPEPVLQMVEVDDPAVPQGYTCPIIVSVLALLVAIIGTTISIILSHRANQTSQQALQHSKEVAVQE